MAEQNDYEVFNYRWVVLAVFALVMAVQAFLWLSFAPIESSVEAALGVSRLQVRLLALVGPFMFIIIGSYAGSLSDRRGWKFVTGIGVGMLAFAGIVKAVFPHLTDSGTAQYWVYLVMQILGGAGSACAMVNLSKMPIKWFPEKQRALANGLTTMGMYLGTAVGLVLVTAVASIPEYEVLKKPAHIAVMQAGIERVLLVVGIIMAVTAVLFFVLAKEEPATPPGPVPEEEPVPLREAFPRFMRSSSFRALCVVSLVGYGVYVALTVTMEKIVKIHGAGFGKSFASLVAAGITIGGIVGAAVLPGVSEKVGLRKPFLILAAGATIPGLLLIAFVGVKPVDVLFGVIMGFCLLPALPVTFTIVGEMEEIGPRLAATAVGTLLALGSIGSVVVPLLMEPFTRKTAAGIVDYRWSMLMLAVLVGIALVIVIASVEETGPKKKAEAGPEPGPE